jgi:hypothetical protein
MRLRKFAGALLLIATGSLAFGVARADSRIVAAFGETGQVFDNRLPAMYSDDLTAFELASKSLFGLACNLSEATGLGSFAASEPLAEVAFAVPFNFSGGWVTSFSNLSLPGGVYSQSMSDALMSPGFQDWMAAPDFRIWLAELPPAFEMARHWEIEL